MPQATIQSFFSKTKQERPKPRDPDAKSRKLENQHTPSSRASVSSGLEAYALSKSKTTSDRREDEDEEKLERHRSFYDYFTKPRLRRSQQLDGGSSRRKMKPYDLQFIEIKKQNMEAVLLIQNGYKYQILGEDAHRVARILGRSPISGWRTLDDEGDPTDALYDRFASLTFPIERLPFYVEKLVMQGFKISVAKQLETSALKAQSDNKRGPFRREVTDTYTKGTLVEELTSSSMVTGHLLALIQEEKYKYSMIAVQPATGDALYDSFVDSSVAMELETRLLHVQPSEILVVGQPLEGIAEKLIDSLNVRVVNYLPEEIEGLPAKVAEFVPDNLKNNEGLTRCYAVLYDYLTEFKLNHALDLDLHPFSLQSFMYLNGDTLQSLEIYENQTTSEPLGSLMWALDVTHTQFGKRLLRSWIGKPLMDRTLLAERVEAMEEIMNAEGPAMQMFADLRKLLPRMPDLERYTLQIYHGRIPPKQLYWYLYFLNLMLNSITEPQVKASKLHSPMLEQLFASFQPTLAIVTPLLACINANYVRNSRDSSTGNLKLSSYFKTSSHDEGDTEEGSSQLDDFADLESLEFQIDKCRDDFTEFLRTESENLGIALRQVNAQGEEDTFVIGVAKRDATKVPASWRRQGSVTTEVRFWAPFSIEQSKKLKPLLEKQAVVASETYTRFVARIAQTSFNELRKCVQSLATLDCLFSLAAVSSRPQYVKPDIVDEPCIEIDSGRHPILEQLSLSTIIPNTVEMYHSTNRCMIITGANMGGKSSYVKQVALLVIMAQVGYYIPASRARLSVTDGIYTRMGAFDNLLRGESTFMVELKECSAIMAKATRRSLVILDEIGRGTSTMDGVAIADAVLQYMIEDVKSFTLFITHYPLLCEKAQDWAPAVQNWSMDCAESDEEVTFLYKIVKKQASRSYGINIARLAGVPRTIVTAAQGKSREFEQLMDKRRSRAQLVHSIRDVLAREKPVNSLLEEISIDPDREEIMETQEL